MKKIKTGTMLYKETIKLCDENLLISGSTSRNEFIEKSIKHYVGYLLKDNNVNYLNKVIDQTLNNQINILEDKLSISLFKSAVEISVLSNIIAATTEIDTETLKRLRLESINKVKQTGGKIDLDEIFKSYSTKEGD